MSIDLMMMMMFNFLFTLVASGQIRERKRNQPVLIKKRINKYMTLLIKYTYKFRFFFLVRQAKLDVCALSRVDFFSLYLFVLCFRPIVPSGTIQARTSQSAKFAASSGISDWVNDFFSSILFLLFSVFFLLWQLSDPKKSCERGRKVAITNKLIL